VVAFGGRFIKPRQSVCVTPGSAQASSTLSPCRGKCLWSKEQRHDGSSAGGREPDVEAIILLVSAINMPGMTGLELLPVVKQCRPDLPVFMISAYGDTVRIATALERGASEFLTKPVGFRRLKRDITAVIAGASNPSDLDAPHCEMEQQVDAGKVASRRSRTNQTNGSFLRLRPETRHLFSASLGRSAVLYRATVGCVHLRRLSP
jgi:DNA-binding response OmpR family regulator